MCGFPAASTVASASVTWLHSRKYANEPRMAPGIRNLGLESPAPEICGHLFRAYPELSREEADTCTSELEAGTSTSGEEVGIRMSEMGADRRASQVEADRCIPAEVADSRLRAVGALNVARRCSIAVARRRCMQSGASGRRSMTSLVTP